MRLRPLRPLTRETSAGGCRCGGAGLRPRSPQRAALPVPGAGTPPSGGASASPLDASPRRRRRGWASAPPLPGRCRRARRASARAPAGHVFARGAGIRRSAAVLADRVGCRSRRAALGPGRKAMGLALWLPAHAGELSRRKRAGSRVAAAKAAKHASSDTGGGLLVIPRARRASVGRARGREHSAMEGVPERCETASLTRRRPDRSRRPEAMGMRQRCRIRRGRTGASEVMSQARPAVENTAGGRFGAEEPSIGAPPGLRWTAHVNGRGLGPDRRDPPGIT